MAYPYAFHRIVMIGSLYDDTFNTSIAFANVAGATDSVAVTQSLADDIADAIAARWTQTTASGAGPGLSVNATLELVKVNRIGTDGRYMDAEAISSVSSLPVSGPTGATIAPQLSQAVTLVGTAPRAKAGLGRMYFPPHGGMTSLDSSGRVSVANTGLYAAGVATLIGAISDAYIAASVAGVPAITSDAGTGAIQAVASLKVGRVPDTIRSRRNKQDEDYQTQTL